MNLRSQVLGDGLRKLRKLRGASAWEMSRRAGAWAGEDSGLRNTSYVVLSQPKNRDIYPLVI